MSFDVCSMLMLLVKFRLSRREQVGAGVEAGKTATMCCFTLITEVFILTDLLLV